MAENSDSSAKEQPARRKKRGGPGRPFQPGQSGNPGGRPAGFAAMVREKCLQGEPLVDFGLRVAQGLEVDATGGTIKEQVEVARLRLDASKWLAERGWGAPQQLVEHTGADGGALTIHIDLGAGK